MQSCIICNHTTHPAPKTISVAELQKQIGTITRNVGYEKQHFILTNHGYEFAAILPYAEYQALVKLRNAHEAGRVKTTQL